MQNPIINLYRSLDEAMYFKNSPRNAFYSFSGIQLLPNNPNKYIQVTNTPNGINLEDWTVYGVSVCGNTEVDITESFTVESLTNSLNGNPQLIWSLENVQHDFGWGLIYLRIEQALGETFYSNPFKFTSINEELVSQITYKYKRTEEYQSIGAQLWFRTKSSNVTIQNYYETSTEKTRTTAVQKNKTEFWETESMSIDNLIKIMDIVVLPYVYLNGIRANCFEAPEIPKPTAQENWGNMEYHFSLDYDEIFIPPQVSAGDWLDADWLGDDFLIFTTT